MPTTGPIGANPYQKFSSLFLKLFINIDCEGLAREGLTSEGVRAEGFTSEVMSVEVMTSEVMSVEVMTSDHLAPVLI